MTDTHEAVRLADALTTGGNTSASLEQAAALLRRIPELEAERDRLSAELAGRWLPIGFLWRHKDEPDSQYRFCSDLKQAEDSHLLMHTDVILVCPAKSAPPATQGSEE